MKRFDPEWAKHVASGLTNAANLPLVSLEAQTTQFQILPDKQVSLGNFRPHPLLPNAFLAHPQTIRAVRKEVFLVGEGTEDLALEIPCDRCKKMLDWQFWQHCPYCETAMPREFKNPKFSIS